VTAVVVGIPHTAPFPGAVVEALWLLEKPEGTTLRRMPNRPVDEARNRLALWALQKRASHLLFWDADARPPAGGLMRLLGREKDVVSGLSFGRRWPHFPVSLASEWQDGASARYTVDVEETSAFLERHRRLWPSGNFQSALLPQDTAGALVERAAVGMAFTLVRCEVLQAVVPDWKEAWEAGRLPDWFRTADGFTGEDSYFCRLARKRGWAVWLDRTVVVGHGYGDAYAGPMDWLGWMAYLKTLPPDEFERLAKQGVDL